MHITATCSTCQKKYKVDAAMGGKKAKCKACGASFTIPVAAPADASDDLMAGLMAAAEAEHKPAPPAARQTPAPRPAQAPKPPARPPAKKPPAIEGVADDFGEMDLSPPIAPAMGAAPPAPLRPAAQPPSGPGRPQARRVVVARQAQPLRPNEEHENKFLAWLDGTLMTVGQAVFWLMVLYILFISIALVTEVHNAAAARGGTVPGKVYAILLLGMPMLLLIWTLGQVPLTTLAAKLSGMMMKFEMPDEPRWRVLTSQMVALSYVLLGWAIVTLSMWLGDSTGGFINSCLRGLALVPFLALITLPLSVPTHFFALWLLLRLSFVEALVAWLFQCVTMVIFGGILLGISLVVLFLSHLGSRF